MTNSASVIKALNLLFWSVVDLLWFVGTIVCVDCSDSASETGRGVRVPAPEPGRRVMYEVVVASLRRLSSFSFSSSASSDLRARGGGGGVDNGVVVGLGLGGGGEEGKSGEEIPSLPVMYSIAADILGEVTMTDPRCSPRSRGGAVTTCPCCCCCCWGCFEGIGGGRDGDFSGTGGGTGDNGGEAWC